MPLTNVAHLRYPRHSLIWDDADTAQRVEWILQIKRQYGWLAANVLRMVDGSKMRTIAQLAVLFHTAEDQIEAALKVLADEGLVQRELALHRIETVERKEAAPAQQQSVPFPPALPTTPDLPFHPAQRALPRRMWYFLQGLKWFRDALVWCLFGLCLSADVALHPRRYWRDWWPQIQAAWQRLQQMKQAPSAVPSPVPAPPRPVMPHAAEPAKAAPLPRASESAPPAPVHIGRAYIPRRPGNAVPPHRPLAKAITLQAIQKPATQDKPERQVTIDDSWLMAGYSA